MIASILGLSDGVTVVTAGIFGLVGALIGGGASFAGTWWERRIERTHGYREAVRTACLDLMGQGNELLKVAGTPELPDMVRLRNAYLDFDTTLGVFWLAGPDDKSLTDAVLAMAASRRTMEQAAEADRAAAVSEFDVSGTQFVNIAYAYLRKTA